MQFASRQISAALMLCSMSLAAPAQDFSSYSGADLYQRFCSACHGKEGHGDGSVAASFKTMVPDLTRITKRRGGTFPDEKVRMIISGRQTVPPHGSREMPVWGFEFYAQIAGKPDAFERTDTIIARLAEYLRSIQRD